MSYLKDEKKTFFRYLHYLLPDDICCVAAIEKVAKTVAFENPPPATGPVHGTGQPYPYFPVFIQICHCCFVAKSVPSMWINFFSLTLKLGRNQVNNLCNLLFLAIHMEKSIQNNLEEDMLLLPHTRLLTCLFLPKHRKYR